MSCMLVEKGIEHGLLHLNGMNNWRFMRCGGSCSHCGNVDPGRATVWQRERLSGFCQTLMVTIRRTVPTSKGGHCRYPCRPGALRPGLGLPQPFGDLLQLPSSAVAMTSSRPPPTSAPTTSTSGPCGTSKTTNKLTWSSEAGGA